MATKKLKGLGRGLDALLGGDSQPAPVKAPSSLKVDQIQAGKYQPRTRMDETSLSELAASIKNQGIMQPVLVRDVDDQSAAAMALIENIQREDLNPLEEAQGIQRLINDFSFTHEQAAAAVGRSRSAVSNLLRLINLAQPVQTMLMAGDIDMGHARALLAVDSANQITLANHVIAKRLSVRETEKLVARALEEQSSPATPARAKDKPGDIVRLEEELSDKLATPVMFKMGAKGKGQLIIDFADLDILDGVLARLRA
jgi:ParB family chromosome partitioning protein